MLSRQEVRDFIFRENASHQVVVWSKSDCPRSEATKTLFRALEEVASDLMIHEIDQHAQGGMIQIELQSLTSQRTTPNVFVGNQNIGGNAEVQRAFIDGSLLELLENYAGPSTRARAA